MKADKLLQRQVQRGRNFWGANLSQINLNDVDLSQAVLTKANLMGAQLRGAKLSGSELKNANLVNADLSYASLSNSNLSGVDLSAAILRGADLSRTNLKGAVETALSKICLSDRDQETVYYAYVADFHRKLVGVVSLEQLVFSIPNAPLGKLASTKVIKVWIEMPQEEVARLLKRYDLLVLPVVDCEQRLVGMITIDDVVDILEEEATEDIQKLARVSGDSESVLTTPQAKIHQRLPWLLLVMALYIGAASAIAPFQSVISLVPVLAVIMPIFSNTGGTVGIQALTVTIRGLGMGEVTPRDTWRILRQEILAGLGMALALGLTLVILSLIWAPPQERWVAIVAGLVMAINVLVAVTLGTLLPMGFKRLDLDPALISGPLLTTVLDGVGFMIFLSLISVALNVLQLNP